MRWFSLLVGSLILLLLVVNSCDTHKYKYITAPGTVVHDTITVVKPCPHHH
jgi:hypothetical protein